MVRTRHTSGCLGLAVLLTAAGCGSGEVLGAAKATVESTPQAAARQILDATGTKGGLIVHLDCGDGRLTAALGTGDGYLVQGLDTDPANVDKARAHIRSLGLYGKVSVDRWDGKRLPYIDNFVNLLVSERAVDVPRDELLRVLVPGGTAYVEQGGRWHKTVKPRPDNTDEWTHYLHDATGNPVAHDTVVGPPRRYQWLGSPRWSRHHDHMASFSALVSAGGRLFYIVDEGSRASIQLPAKWFLVARDALNGTVLWKRPIPSWNTHLWPLKSGPAQLPRRLVAVGERVYVTLGLDAPLAALDAATGETIRTFQGTANTEEVIASDGVLLVLACDAPSKWPTYRQEFSYVWDNTRHANSDWAWDMQKRHLLALEAETGRVLWKKDAVVAPLTLAADNQHVYFHDGQEVVCLDRAGGGQLWTSEPIERRKSIPTCFGPRLLVWQDVVLFAGGTRSMTALSARTGETLWTAKHPRSGHQSPEDLLVMDGLVYSGATANGNDSGIFTGRDPHTGQVKREFPPDVKTYWFHQRCYPSKATDRYLLPSRTGIEFVDPQTGHWTIHHWVRGGCIYGIMPCNGLIYALPHSCGCYPESKLCGFNALAPESEALKKLREADDDNRLERGPAFAQIRSPKSEVRNPGDWPTYRHDAARSGFTKTPLPVGLKGAWQTELGGRLSSVVIADGRLFVAAVDTHTVHALDADSGKPLWSYTTGGRVDSPPTIWQGRVLFGSADGWVYCLRESDGALIWRFRAAPADLRMTAFEQIESVWPVHGSVLVDHDMLYVVAGRSMFLDGGLRLLRLDPQTGRKLSETVLNDRDPESGKNLQIYVRGLTMPVALPDVLSSDGRHIYMRSQRFDLSGVRQQIAPLPVQDQAGEGDHLFCQVGFLDDSWFFRSYWLYGRAMGGGYGGWFQAGRLVPSGRIMVFDGDRLYGYGRKPQYMVNASVLEYQLYAADRQIRPESIRRVRQANAQINAKSDKASANASDWKVREGFPVNKLWGADLRWSKPQLPLLVRAMVLADRTLLLAGPPNLADEKRAFYQPDDPAVRAALAQQDAALEGRKGALLLAVSATDGKKLAERQLQSPPVWDGMAAAAGRVYLATLDGKVICFKD
jgi:outer membrane protein assembly factor BamB